MTDSQRSKVYAWEKTLPTSKMTMDEIKALADTVCKAYQIETVNVGDGRRRRRGAYAHSTHTIKLPVFSRHKSYVLHELAHAIAETMNNEYIAHGPIFVRTMLDLHARFGEKSFSMRKARSDARAARIKIATTKIKTVPARALGRIQKIDAELAELNARIRELHIEKRGLTGLPVLADRGPAGLMRLLSI